MEYSHDHRHNDRNNHRNPNRQERDGHRQPRSMVRGPSADLSYLFDQPAQMKEEGNKKAPENEPVKIFNNQSEREQFTLDAALNISDAAARYSDAVTDAKIKIKEIASQKSEMAAFVLDVAFGFLTPGIGKLLTRIATSLPINTPAVKTLFTKYISNDKINSPIISAVSGVAKEKLETAFQPSQNETDSQLGFVEILRDINWQTMQDLRERRNEWSDEEIIIFKNLFDASQTKVEDYKLAIIKLTDRFKKEVLEADDYESYVGPSGGSTSTFKNHVVRVNHSGTVKYAIVREFNNYHALSFLTGTNQRFTFVRWISNDMKELAVKQAGGHSKVLDGAKVNITNIQ